MEIHPESSILDQYLLIDYLENAKLKITLTFIISTHFCDFDRATTESSVSNRRFLPRCFPHANTLAPAPFPRESSAA